MNYYFLEPKLNDLTGSPPIVGLTEVQDPQSATSIYSFGKIDFPDISEIRYMILDKNVTPSDVLCAEMLMLTGLLVNEKVKSILLRFTIPTHRFYPCFIKDNIDYTHNYYWMQTSSERDSSKFIDFEKSIFYIRKDILGLSREEIKIESVSALEKVRSELMLGEAVKLSKVTLTSDFKDLNLDLFKITGLYPYWIISEKLKEQLENQEVSGIKLRPAREIFIE